MALPIASKLLMASVLLVSIGCTCSDTISTPREVDPLTKARLRTIVASPDAPDLRVTQNDRVLEELVTRLDTAAAYGELPSGIRNLRFLGITSGVAYHSVNVDLAVDRSFTYVLFDSAAQVRGMLAKDDVPTATPGFLHLRVIHVAKGIGAVSILSEGTPLAPSIAYPTADAYVAAPVGATVTLEVQGAGTPRSVPVDLRDAAAGRAYTLVLDVMRDSLRVRRFADR